MIQHLNYLADYSADQKLAAYLLSLDNKRRHSEIKHVDLANYLSLTPETLSRSFKKLKKAELIDTSQNRIEIPNPDKLARLLQ